MWKESRRKKLQATPLPPAWRGIVETRCALYQRLPEADREELAGDINVFLAEKNFEGCGGLTLTDEIRVCIAAHACILLLHRRTDYFPGLRSILVYPNSYFAQVTHHVGSGVWTESWQSRAGEAWPSGAIVLAWEEVLRGAMDAHQSNVVLHEFAHQLDFEDGGAADGTPFLARDESWGERKRRYKAWVDVMTTEFAALKAQTSKGEPSFLGAYAATKPAEFFAVLTDFFFTNAVELQRQHRALYEELKWFYRQDPAAWP